MKNRGFMGVVIALFLILSVTIIGCQTGGIEKDDLLTMEDTSHVISQPDLASINVLVSIPINDQLELITEQMEGGSVVDGTFNKQMLVMKELGTIRLTGELFNTDKGNSSKYPIAGSIL